MSVCVYRQLNLLSTATPAIGAWLVPIDQLKSSLRKLDMEGTLRVCAVMGCIMTEALEVRSTYVYTSGVLGLLVELLFQNIFLSELNIMEKPFKTVKIPSNRWLYLLI